MRGRLASRAHSFKENILNALGHHNSSSNNHGSQQQQGGGNNSHDNSFNSSASSTTTAASKTPLASETSTEASSKPRSNSNAAQSSSSKHLSVSKKTNSTDNIIDYVTSSANTIADPRSTEAMVREINLALRYFQDAVAKGTYEMLPGCATVVLETVLAMQSYALSRRDPKKRTWSDRFDDDTSNTASAKITTSTKSMCSAVAKLTQWADRVITDGCVDPNEEYVKQVIDPVRAAVNALASNLLAICAVPRSMSLYNSLPDLASPDRDEAAHHQNVVDAANTRQQPRSFNEATTTGSGGHHRPPPLPPKGKSHSQSDDSMDPLSSEPSTSAHVDWFSNPLFDNGSGLHKRSNRARSAKKKRATAAATNTRTYSESSVDNNVHKTSTASTELDTTLPDFCQPQRMSVCEQTNVSYIDVSPNNLSRESFEFDGSTGGLLGGAAVVGPLATSSPRPEVANTALSRTTLPMDYYPDNTSSSTSSDIPPALPRKIRQPPPPPLPPGPPRKTSTYDNVGAPPNTSFPTFQVYPDPMGPTPLIPPPLPPKKKHIMSYMEMFGRSLVTTDEELVQSLTRTKDLLEAVWQQNYHDFTTNYNSISSSQYGDPSSGPGGGPGGPDDPSGRNRHRQNDMILQFGGMGVRPILRTSHSSYLLPPPELAPPPPPPMLVAAQYTSSGMPPPFPNLPGMQI
jgi:hypothetical protein